MKNTSKNVDGTAGLVGAAAIALAASQGAPNTNEYLSKTIPESLARNNAWDSIAGFWAYLLVGWPIVVGLPAGLMYLIDNDLMPEFLADISWMYIPLLVFLVPFAYALAGLPMARDHMFAKVRARVYEPGGRAWAKAASHPGGMGGFIETVFFAALYIPAFLPVFIIQDTIELLHTTLTLGKHTYRTSKGHYFDRQRKRYQEIARTKGIEEAERFLLATSKSMHLSRDADNITMAQWRNGLRSACIGPLERKYGPLLEKNGTHNGNNKGITGATPKEKHTVRHEFDHIKVKPIKL
ncbi:hypothetical protein [Marinobacter persicus]|uniref:Uncharacterized protein n=1 Tax=Marinobacter persicus TaxID=930118 RepID=A0A2S6G313_9GAMM|nr:hypothetical protein [Marinobacter persicus]KXS54390.1 MAG: hypothetical protein AWU57_1223 [Marinobacter sp. T13-3]PPK50231.1 hypothetical protein BY455_1302 [Marinobacter persicus]PPK52856.1 hypothetical protein B0H24_10312 [Marinobacter persicus]PPK56719.1 hypothetical protein BY454_1332 [Marinobacter persicus]